MYSYNIMGFFNFIETFFFISLGITLVLILLLVYHFKQRLTSLENNGETMFEIVNTMANEMTGLKELTVMSIREMTALRQQQQMQKPSSTEDSGLGEMAQENIHTIVSSPELDHNVTEIYDIAELDDADMDDEETDLEEDDETDDDTDDEDDMSEFDIDGDLDDILGKEAISKIPVSDDDTVPGEDEIKEVVLDLVEEVFDNITISENANELDITLVNGVEEVVDVSEEVLEPTADVDSIGDSKKDILDSFNKMSTSELKALVIQRGVATDPSKLKRPKLLALLEASLEN
jgi:hypothetical protein